MTGAVPRAAGAAQRLGHGLAFVSGLSLVFVALGYGAGFVGEIFFVYDRAIRIGAGLVLIAMGLVLVGVVRPRWMSREMRVRITRHPGGYGGSALVGLAFGVGWTPCVGPVLAGVLALASSSGSALRGAGLLAAYAVGFALPFLAVAVLMPTTTLARRVGPHIERIAGAMLIALGALLLSGQLARLAPTLAALGSAEGALAGLPPGVAVSVAAGALSFLSPCVLPLVPIYMAFLTGVIGHDDHRSPAPPAPPRAAG
jgi:cytochrome c-type biogenesis protein